MSCGLLLLEAVTRQAELVKSIDDLKKQKQEQANKLAIYKQYQKDLANETQWRETVKNLDRAINAATQTISELDTKRDNHREEILKFDGEQNAANTAHQAVFGTLRTMRQKNSPSFRCRAACRLRKCQTQILMAQLRFYLREYSKASDMSRDLEVAFSKARRFC